MKKLKWLYRVAATAVLAFTGYYLLMAGFIRTTNLNDPENNWFDGFGRRLQLTADGEFTAGFFWHLGDIVAIWGSFAIAIYLFAMSSDKE